MKIVERKNKKNTHEFKFDNGAWCSICTMGEESSWECQMDEADEETYSEGGLWFDGKELVDYDGCFELPDAVRIALKELGYSWDY